MCVVAAIASIGLGAVIVGPSAPLLATRRWAGRPGVVAGQTCDAPAQTVVVVGAAGSFAAISFLFGNPLLGAILMMEIIGLGGANHHHGDELGQLGRRLPFAAA